MRKLLQGILEFRRFVFPAYRGTFARLAQAQSPDCLFVACSDSRVVPNLFASTHPGDLFVMRNIGNLVPSFATAVEHEDDSAAAVLEYAVSVLGVKDVIVCGHSSCGAMRALLGSTPGAGLPHVGRWLAHGTPAVQRFLAGDVLDPALPPHDQLSQLNVLAQLEHVASHPFVAERVAAGRLHLHGFWFDVGAADVFAYEPSAGRFRIIDEAEAQRMIDRMEGRNA